MIIEIIILILAIPIGFLLARIANDELILGRAWFRALIIISILGGIWFFLTGNKSLALTFIFILIVSLINYIKSFERN